MNRIKWNGENGECGLSFQTFTNIHMQCTQRIVISLQHFSAFLFFFFFLFTLLEGQVRMIVSIIIHRPRFHKVYMPGVNERTCGFPRVSSLAPVSAVSESLIAVTLRDRQAWAKTMASKSWRLTATDSHLPPKHTSGPQRCLSSPFPLSFLSLSGEIEETQR